MSDLNSTLIAEKGHLMRITKKPSKKIQNNLVIQPLSKKSWSEIIADRETRYLSYNNYDKSYAERIELTLRLWVEEPDSLSIVQFCAEYKIDYDHLKTMTDKFDFLQQTLKDIKRVLGERRKMGALKKIYHADTAFRDIHLYDPDWAKDVDKYHDDRKKEIDSQMSQIFGNIIDCAKLSKKLSYEEKEAIVNKAKEESK